MEIQKNWREFRSWELEQVKFWRKVKPRAKVTWLVIIFQSEIPYIKKCWKKINLRVDHFDEICKNTPLSPSVHNEGLLICTHFIVALTIFKKNNVVLFWCITPFNSLNKKIFFHSNVDRLVQGVFHFSGGFSVDYITFNIKI